VNENGKAKRKKFLYEFSLSGLASLFVFTVLIMVWMFILGVLVGRGYRPETVIPQLAKVLPQEQAPHAGAGSAAPQQDGQAPQEQPTLKAEELGFYEDLKGSRKPRAASPKPAPAKPSPQPAQPQPSPPQAQAAVQQATATPTNKPEPAPAPARVAAIKPNAEPAPDPGKVAAISAQTQKFRYIYQVAAFKQEDRAAQFRDQAKAKGYNASFVREPVFDDEYWYRVLVTLEGTLQENERLRSGLESLGVKNPLLRSKKPL
jgi:DedD protein